MKNAIYTSLKNAGFDVEIFGKFMIVGLNRKVSILEVWTAINCQGDTSGWINSDGKVWIQC